MTDSLGDHPVPTQHITQIARLLRKASASCVCEIPDDLASRTIGRCFDLPHPADVDETDNI
ncbi:MAG: hypothetical protein H7144_00135 [Burkholderiales bacterium]|nr:hypothetical protein [Phycisphaerae bacterium]